MTYKYDALDLSQEDIKKLKEYLRVLEKEGGGLCVPIRAEKHVIKKSKYNLKREVFYDEWELANNWK